MALLDELSGFEFEELMADVFRKLGYEHVRQAARTADEGRDVLMEEVVDGQRRAVVVECKHTDSVGRPVVQKLHSAVATYEFDGPKRGIAVTTGRFTGPAQEYADRLRETDDPHPIELLDGRALREIGEEVGLDLHNGRIEVLCEETLRPVDPVAGRDGPVREAFGDIANLDSEGLPTPESTVTFRPTLAVTTHTRATFETSVGVIHRLDERDTLVVHARRGDPQVLDGAVGTLVRENAGRTVALDEPAMAETFDDVTVLRFGRTETAYKQWAIDRVRERHTTTVHYTGGNNVDYEKTCTPRTSDVSVQSIDPVYVPLVSTRTRLGDYDYPYEYYAAGPSRVVRADGIRRCVHCDADGPYTYCENCGAISCETHIETERLVGEPVCTGCAVTERFFLRTRYFYDEANRAAFREAYEAMPFHEKARENVPLVAGVLVAAVVALALLAVQVGLL